MATAAQVSRALRHKARPEKAKILSGFFKTGTGQYGAGDTFIGVVVPDSREVAGQFHDLPLSEIARLLASKIHEERLVGLFILVNRYRRHPDQRQEIFDFYCAHRKCINNWDLVDSSADKIMGMHLRMQNRGLLYELARSPDLWERRIAIVSTFAFIRAGEFSDTFRITELLLNDPHDLIHKAAGWMLREAGKRDQIALERFLKKHYRTMPRTMLRYAIEKFPEKRRQAYLKGQV